MATLYISNNFELHPIYRFTEDSFSNCVQGLKFTPTSIGKDQNGDETRVCVTQYGYSGRVCSYIAVLNMTVYRLDNLNTTTRNYLTLHSIN